MPAALVSIIIPCLNAARILGRCLSSCATQTHSHLEVIFVDNGSTDESLRLARAFAAEQKFPVTVAECATPGGNAARRAGFQLARGDYVQCLDADDELTPSKIERQVAALEAVPEVDVAYG